MRCKIDENIPTEAVALWHAAGHECDTVMDEGLSGARDDTLYKRCQDEGRVFVTLDLDFADLRTYAPDDSPGIIVLRPVEPDRDRVLRLVRHAVSVLKVESVAQSLWIVEALAFASDAEVSLLSNMRMDLSIALVLKEVVCSFTGTIKDRSSCE